MSNLVAVLVVKPDEKVFQDMLLSLKDPNSESYDGADQGFLVGYFKEMQNAPYFDPKNPSPNDKMNRLAIGYSMNHIYYYEKSTWDNGWRQGQFKDLEIPAYILTYPIAVNLKVSLDFGKTNIAALLLVGLYLAQDPLGMGFI
jgi:hypothetical protein